MFEIKKIKSYRIILEVMLYYACVACLVLSVAAAGCSHSLIFSQQVRPSAVVDWLSQTLWASLPISHPP